MHGSFQVGVMHAANLALSERERCVSLGEEHSEALSFFQTVY